MAGVLPSPRVTIASVLLAILGVTSGCAGPGDRPEASTPSSPEGPSGEPKASPAASPAAQLAATLSDEDLVGQVLMPYAYGASATEVSPGSAAGNQQLAGVDTPAEMIDRYRVGGLILVGFSADDPTGSNQPTTNVDSTTQVRELTTGLQDAAGRLPAAALPDGVGELPLLIGTDQEFGIVTRINQGVTLLPSAMAAGAAGQPELTEAAWRAAGTELAALGVNVDFAPVADVLGVNSTVIGSRSYGADPDAAAGQVAAAVRGLQAAGVAATLKHFPGHGHTAVDSHGDLPVLDQDRTALAAADLPPFVAGIDAGAGLVMSGHLDVAAIDPGVAATFSRKVLTDLLRGELGFDGVVVTDGMNMAPARALSPGDAAVAAINAGNDLILMPPDVTAAYEGLLAALRDGSLPRTRLVQAVTRVLTLKQRLAEETTPPMTVLGAEDHYAAARRLAAAAVTQVRGDCAGVDGPVTVTASGGRERTRALLIEELRAAGVEVVGQGGTVVHLVGYGDGPSDLNVDAAVTVAMDTPHLLAEARSATLLATYSSSPASMSALADVLRGAAPAPGRLPVPVSGLPATSCTG